MRRPPRAARGLTLTELLVGLAVSLIVLTAALGLLHQMGQVRRRQEVREQLGSTAAWLLGSLGHELRLAGLGRPRTARAEFPGEPFPPAFLLADAQQVVFIADVPRPDSQLNGVSSLAAEPFPSTDSLALLNELNGDCDVDTTGASCSTNTSTHVFAPSPGGCGSDPASRTCPWGLGRYRPDEHVVVVSGSGRWVERQLANPVDTTVGARRVLRLTVSIPTTGLVEGPNRGWTSTPDRLFYRLTPAGELQRNQCWGSLGSPIDLTALVTPCNAGALEGTGWETLAKGLPAGGLAFTYLDVQGNTLATPVAQADLPRVRRVRVALQLQQAIAGTVLAHSDSITVSPRP